MTAIRWPTIGTKPPRSTRRSKSFSAVLATVLAVRAENQPVTLLSYSLKPATLAGGAWPRSIADRSMRELMTRTRARARPDESLRKPDAGPIEGLQAATRLPESADGETSDRLPHYRLPPPAGRGAAQLRQLMGRAPRMGRRPPVGANRCTKSRPNPRHHAPGARVGHPRRRRRRPGWNSPSPTTASRPSRRSPSPSSKMASCPRSGVR